jgi:hypothetical protein
MSWQTLAAAALVLVCSAYAAWALMPQALRRRLQQALGLKPTPVSGCGGCSSCDDATAAKAQQGAGSAGGQPVKIVRVVRPPQSGPGA